MADAHKQSTTIEHGHFDGVPHRQTHTDQRKMPAQLLLTRSCYFPFLDLPRELRDMIYAVMLVRGDVKCIARKVTTDSTLSVKSSKIPVKQRGTFIASLHRNEGTIEYKMSYKIRTRSDLSDYISIFLINNQVYHEATRIFYLRNKFCFPGVLHYRRLPPSVCCAFLQDRTSYTLGYIRSLEIEIQPRIRSRTKCPQTGDAIITHRLLAMVEVINTNLTQLEHLSFQFIGEPPDLRKLPWPYDLEWVDVLLRLPKLKSLAVCYNNANSGRYTHSSDDVGRMVAFVSFLRSRLLKNGDQLGTRNIQVHNRHDVGLYNGFWKRKKDRVLEIKCHDNDKGKSLLQPVRRKSPRVTGVVQKRLKGENRANEERRRSVKSHFHTQGDGNAWKRYSLSKSQLRGEQWGASDVSDWDVSDDSDNDSLNGIDISGMNTSYAVDKGYLQNRDETEG